MILEGIELVMGTPLKAKSTNIEGNATYIKVGSDGLNYVEYDSGRWGVGSDKDMIENFSIPTPHLVKVRYKCILEKFKDFIYYPSLSLSARGGFSW